MIPPTLSFVPQSSTVGVGAVTTIDFMLDEVPFGLTGYNITVAVSNPSVAEIALVSFPAWATVNENSTLPGSTL